MKKWFLIAFATIALTMAAAVAIIATNETVYNWVNSFPVEALAYHTSESGVEERIVPTLIDGLLYIWNHPTPKIIILTYFINDVLFEYVKQSPWLTSFMVVVVMVCTSYAWVLESWAKQGFRSMELASFVLSDLRSRLIRYWVVCMVIAVIVSAITLNFDINFMTQQWGLRFNGGASLPTSPYLPWQGRLMEYYYHLSIKDFLINNTWSIATTVVVLTMVVWCAIKAHVTTRKAVTESSTLMELVTVPVAAVLALFIAVLAPYRVHFSRTMKEMEHKYDDKMTREAFLTLPLPRAWKEKMVETYQNSDGLVYMLRDRHASYVQRILRVANKE